MFKINYISEGRKKFEDVPSSCFYMIGDNLYFKLPDTISKICYVETHDYNSMSFPVKGQCVFCNTQSTTMVDQVDVVMEVKRI